MDNTAGDNESLGCGSSTTSAPLAGSSEGAPIPHTLPITLNVQTTTGGNFNVVTDPNHTVEYLKKIIAKKLKVSKDRLSLLFRER